ALASVAMVVALQWYSPIGRTVLGVGGSSLELTSFGVAVLAVLLLNISLASANVESTYVALPARWRRAFSAATLAIIFLLAWTTVFISSGILLGRVSLWDVAKSSISFGLLSLAIPYSLVRRRGAEATVTGNPRPFYETLSFVLGVGALLVSLSLVRISRLPGRPVRVHGRGEHPATRAGGGGQSRRAARVRASRLAPRHPPAGTGGRSRDDSNPCREREAERRLRGGLRRALEPPGPLDGIHPLRESREREGEAGRYAPPSGSGRTDGHHASDLAGAWSVASRARDRLDPL